MSGSTIIKGSEMPSLRLLAYSIRSRMFFIIWPKFPVNFPIESRESSWTSTVISPAETLPVISAKLLMRRVTSRLNKKFITSIIPMISITEKIIKRFLAAVSDA